MRACATNIWKRSCRVRRRYMCTCVGVPGHVRVMPALCLGPFRVGSESGPGHVRVFFPSHIPCPSHIRVMSGACPCHIRVISGSCLNHLRVMSGSCPGHVRVMSKSCPSHVRVMSESFPSHDWVMSGSCPSVRSMSAVCPTHVSESFLFMSESYPSHAFLP